MTNLIPPDAKKSLKVEYWVRTCSVFAILLSIVLVAISGLMAPTYVLISSQHRAIAAQQTTEVAEDAAAYEAALAEMDTANTLAQRLQSSSQNYDASLILGKIQTNLSPEIRLNGFQFTNGDLSSMSIRITGQASTRRALVDFVETLESRPGFLSVEVPVSDLALDSDLPFSAKITLSESYAE